MTTNGRIPTDMKPPRLSHPTLRLLAAFLATATPLAGSDIVRATKMLSGTLYPVLMRLEGAGWLKSKWETIDPSKMGRPRKRLYRLTALGKKKAKETLAELR